MPGNHHKTQKNGKMKEKESEERVKPVKTTTCLPNTRKQSYIVLIYISFCFSIIMGVLNAVDLIYIYVKEAPPYFPTAWNLWFNVIHIINFYLLLYAYIYARSHQNRSANMSRMNNYAGSDNDANGDEDTKCTSAMINIAFFTFLCSFALHIYTGFFILDYQPPDYLTD